jgi:hypothetical protein
VDLNLWSIPRTLQVYLNGKTTFNISLNRNKVLKLGADDSPIYVTNWDTTTKTEVGTAYS